MKNRLQPWALIEPFFTLSASQREDRIFKTASLVGAMKRQEQIIWGRKVNENAIGNIIVETSIDIHRELGSGLLESVYEVVLFRELLARDLDVERQAPIPIKFRGYHFDEAFRADLVIENKVIVELKVVEATNNAHKKQLLTYLKLAKMKLGYLLNFGEVTMKRGITRIVNGLPEDVCKK